MKTLNKPAHAFLTPALITSVILGCGPTPPGGHGGTGGCTGSACGGAAGNGGNAGMGGTTSPSDAGVEAAPPDSGLGSAPPPGCLPPCLEDAIRQCVPSFGACLVNETTSDAGPVTSTMKRTCDPTSKWTLVESSAHPFGSETLLEDGAECYARSLRVVNIGGRPAAEVTYYSFGEEVARGADLQEGRFVTCPEGGTYPLETSDPQCAAWIALVAPHAACSSTTPGECL
jgi:hypothetical protein